MALTPAQLQTLKTNINSIPELAALPNNSDGAFAIQAYYVVTAAPDFFVYRTSVPVTEIMQNGFDWSRVDNLTIGKARVWEWMTTAVLINPAQDNVRAGIIATFNTAGDLAMRQAIFTHCQRLANRGEKLFAVGAGTSVTEQGVGPATMAVEGVFSLNDIIASRSLP